MSTYTLGKAFKFEFGIKNGSHANSSSTRSYSYLQMMTSHYSAEQVKDIAYKTLGKLELLTLTDADSNYSLNFYGKVTENHTIEVLI